MHETSRVEGGIRPEGLFLQGSLVVKHVSGGAKLRTCNGVPARTFNLHLKECEWGFQQQVKERRYASPRREARQGRL
jgi:hypothetical protein